MSYPGRGLKDRSSFLPWSCEMASGGVLGDYSGTWDELAVGAPGEDAPVGVRTPPRPNLPNRRIRDPYVRW